MWVSCARGLGAIQVISLNLFDLLTQSGHDPASRDVEPPGVRPSSAATVDDVVAVDAGAPEGLPGGLVEAAANAFGRPGEEAAAVLDVEEGRILVVRSGLCLEERDHVGVAGPVAGRSPPPRGQKVDDQVAGDPEEPGAKRSPGRVGIPAVDRPGHRAKNILREVVRVGPLQSPPAGQAIDQRLVDLQELHPRLLVPGRLRRTSRLGRVPGGSVKSHPPQ